MGGVCSFCNPNSAKNQNGSNGKDAFISGSSGDALLGESISFDGEAQMRYSSNKSATTKISLKKTQHQDEELIEQQRALREKQRLDTLVATAAHEMIAIHRRDGYYDPREAAMVASSLNPTIKETTTPGVSSEQEFVGFAPKVGYSNVDVLSVLTARMPWEQPSHEWSWLMDQPGVAAGGDNVYIYLDDLSETYLKRILPPAKDHFGSGLASVVENLP